MTQDHASETQIRLIACNKLPGSEKELAMVMTHINGCDPCGSTYLVAANHEHINDQQVNAMATGEHSWGKSRLTDVGNRVAQCPDRTCQGRIDGIQNAKRRATGSGTSAFAGDLQLSRLR